MSDSLKEIVMNLTDYDAGRRAVDGTHNLNGKISELKSVYAKSEKFDECLELLEELKYTANPHDVMSVYDNVISVFRRHLEE